MTETINLKTNSLEANVLRFAMEARRTLKGRRVSEWGPNGDPLVAQVKLTVNDVEVPFVETLRSLWDNENARIEERAKELALKMLSEASLMPAVNSLREVNMKLRKVMGKVAAAIPDS